MSIGIEHYGSVYQTYAGQAARAGQDLSKDARLLLAAMSRANNGGHAIFEPGELREILGRTLPDGTRKPASRSTVYDTIAKLRAAGLLLGGGGGEICLWLPAELWTRNLKRRDDMCPMHRSARGGWVSNAA
ncbi:hypothetical protein SMC26_15500 [Actinomadura fulvescens]|uniref:Uncharacterized protein n=1 Tax=Actinomadura fulvescens TaxID=46160 RepID=A0ABN3QTF8_9ACTN